MNQTQRLEPWEATGGELSALAALEHWRQRCNKFAKQEPAADAAADALALAVSLSTWAEDVTAKGQPDDFNDCDRLTAAALAWQADDETARLLSQAARLMTHDRHTGWNVRAALRAVLALAADAEAKRAADEAAEVPF